MIAVLAIAATLGALPQQSLAKGECGLFLWRMADRPELVVMAKPGLARLVLDGRVVDLPRADGGGEITPGARYAATGGASLSLDLTLEPRPGLLQGAVVRDGSVAITAAGGEEIVTPVAGMLGCR